MLKPRHLDELSRRVLDNLPEGLAAVHEDMRQNLRAAVTTAVQRMDLVSREEFDVQAGVLRRTREKLEALERRVAELESASRG
ncbi:MAG: accessory factor UbiK family protein [Pseudomonadota bacterium]